MKIDRGVLVFFLLLTILGYANIVKVGIYGQMYAVLLNEEGKVFMGFVDKEHNIYRKNIVFFGRAYDCSIYKKRVFIVGSSYGVGVLYVADLTGVVAIKRYDKEARILQVIPSDKGLFLVEERKNGYTFMLTDFYGHIIWKRDIAERSDFIRVEIGKHLYVVFESSVYILDMKANILSKKNYKGISAAFLEDNKLYLIFNKKNYSIIQDGQVFLEDRVKDLCVLGNDVYVIGEKGVWKNKELLLKGVFKGISCAKDCIIIWTDDDFFSMCGESE